MRSPDNDRNEVILDEPVRDVSRVSGADRPARTWQIAATLIGATAIVWLVLYGMNSQNDETKAGGEQNAATQITPPTTGSPPAPQGGQKGNPQQTAQPQQNNQQQPPQNGQSNGQQQAAPAQSNRPSTTGQAPNNGGNNQPATSSGQ